jgi:membrane-bound lytic murein transglycosylase D
MSDIDAASRRELVEVRGKLAGLRDVARRDVARAADGDVLKAPAVDGIEPQLNAEVYRYIEYFTGNGRSTFERWLKRSGRYADLFRQVLQREGLPPDLVNLVFVESGFSLHARSVANAVGPWQFLRSTGRLFGLTVNQWVDERKDPEKSTVAAARYLKHLYAIFGDWPLALASYNAGEGTVLRAIKRQGTTNYWDLRLPRQTEDYVPQFMAVLAISKEPEKYGFDAIELEDPMTFDEVALKGTADLRTIARLAGCTYEELRLLNPSVLRHAAPAREGITVLRVPKGKAEKILAALDGEGVTMPAVDLSVKHKVRRGETLQGIANQYHVSAKKLAADNGIGRSKPLRRGMVLTVRSTMRSGTLAVADIDPADPRVSTAYVPPRPRGPVASLNADSEAEGRFRHTVRRGETLGSIASKYGVSVDDIKRWNRLTTSSVARGTRLKLREGDAAVATPEDLAADSARVASIKVRTGSSIPARKVVTVRAGQTLGGIAAAHGVTTSRLRAANNLSSNTIRAGQRLRIPG